MTFRRSIVGNQTHIRIHIRNLRWSLMISNQSVTNQLTSTVLLPFTAYYFNNHCIKIPQPLVILFIMDVTLAFSYGRTLGTNLRYPYNFAEWNKLLYYCYWKLLLPNNDICLMCKTTSKVNFSWTPHLIFIYLFILIEK